MAKNRGKTNGARQNNNQNNNHNNQRNNQRNIHQGTNSKWCSYCKKNNHNTAQCYHSSSNNTHTNNNNISNNRRNHTEGERSERSKDDDRKFLYCKLCKKNGHDLASCTELERELRAHGVDVQEAGQNGVFLPRDNDSNTFKSNSNRVQKSYNPFERQRSRPNPFTDLVCTHSSQCTGLCGNQFYMSKTKQLKAQLSEVLSNMQLWLDTLTPPKDDPDMMEWQAAPTIEIPKSQLAYDESQAKARPPPPQNTFDFRTGLGGFGGGPRQPGNINQYLRTFPKPQIPVFETWRSTTRMEVDSEGNGSQPPPPPPQSPQQQEQQEQQQQQQQQRGKQGQRYRPVTVEDVDEDEEEPQL